LCGCMCVKRTHTHAQAQMAAAQRGLAVVITECEAHYLTLSVAACRVSVLLLLVETDEGLILKRHTASGCGKRKQPRLNCNPTLPAFCDLKYASSATVEMTTQQLFFDSCHVIDKLTMLMLH